MDWAVFPARAALRRQLRTRDRARRDQRAAFRWRPLGLVVGSEAMSPRG